MNVNLSATFWGLKHAAQHMIATGGGAVVSIASVHGIQASALHAAYEASKGGLISLVRELAVEFGPRGIRVNAISPGLIITPEREADISEQRSWFYAHNYCLRRSGQPIEIAKAALSTHPFTPPTYARPAFRERASDAILRGRQFSRMQNLRAAHRTNFSRRQGKHANALPFSRNKLDFVRLAVVVAVNYSPHISCAQAVLIHIASQDYCVQFSDHPGSFTPPTYVRPALANSASEPTVM